MLRALLIRQPHIDQILDGKKTWEIRGSRTNIRGAIALVASGSGTVIGTCELVGCIGPLTGEQFRKGASKAGMRQSEAKLGYYKRTYAWVLENPKRLEKPVAYKHPPGAIIWAFLNRRVERKVRDQLGSGTAARTPKSSGDKGIFALGDIVSMEYDDQNPERYEGGTFIGIVVRRDGERMKVIYAYENGETDFSWLTRHEEKVPNRWIDKSYAAIVHVEEASTAQRDAFCRWVPTDRQAKLLKSEARE